MAQNTVDPTERVDASKSKAITEEDVRLTGPNGLLGDDFFEYEELDSAALSKLKAEWELKLIARFEQNPEPLVYLGSAGSFNISTSELRTMAARGLANLLVDVQHTAASRRSAEAKRVEQEQKDAAKRAEEDKDKENEKDSDERTSTTPDPDPNLRTTQPAQNIEFLLKEMGKDKEAGVLEDKKNVGSAPGRTHQNETPPRQEVKAPATGKPVEDSNPQTKNPTKTSSEKE